MDIGISITKHARERIVERALDKILKNHLMQVFNTGKRLSYEDVWRLIDRAIKHKGIFVSEYRKFDGLLYIFALKSETQFSKFYRLITVVPYK